MNYTSLVDAFIKSKKYRSINASQLRHAVKTFEKILNEHHQHKHDPHATATRLIEPVRNIIRAGVSKESFETVINFIHASGVCPDGERVIALFKRHLNLK